MKRARFLSVALGVALAAFVVAALLALQGFSAVESFKSGALDGYPLRGTYQGWLQGDRAVSASFDESAEDGAEGTWRWSPSGGEQSGGTYEATDDPNCFRLLDGALQECGLVHVCYGDGREDGLIYLTVQGVTLPMEKIAPVPTRVEPSVE